MLTLSTILSAVKPKDRTDQYAILAALYCLNAHTVSVTAKQVTDRLRLHLGNKTPVNINARLRAYEAYVEPAEKGPPLKWQLTPKGLEHLRGSSGLALTTNTTEADFDTDVGIICALEQPEFESVTKAIGGQSAWTIVGSPRFTHVYRAATIATKNGKTLRIIGTTSTSMGLTAAAIATTQLIMQFRPRLVMMVGIAAGKRGEGDKRFGDVLVAESQVWITTPAKLFLQMA